MLHNLTILDRLTAQPQESGSALFALFGGYQKLVDQWRIDNNSRPDTGAGDPADSYGALAQVQGQQRTSREGHEQNEA